MKAKRPTPTQPLTQLPVACSFVVQHDGMAIYKALRMGVGCFKDKKKPQRGAEVTAI